MYIYVYIYTYMHNNLYMFMQEFNNMEFVPMGKILLIFKQMFF